MPYEVAIGDGADALGQNQLTDALDGTYWIDGWDATLGTGDLEVDIAPGEGAINTGGVETTATQTVDFAADVDAEDPRKAVISVDDTGTVQKTLGDPMPADPEGEVRERTNDPSPPTNAPGVVVAEVWLAAGVTGLVSDDVRDRRVINRSAGGGGLWSEDENSPFSASNTDQLECNLSSDYQRWRVEIVVDYQEPSAGRSFELNLNDEFGSIYEYRTTDGGVREDDPTFRLGRYDGPSQTVAGDVKVSAFENGIATIEGPAGIETEDGRTTLELLSGKTTAEIGKINKITLSTGEISNELTLRAYGRDVI